MEDNNNHFKVNNIEIENLDSIHGNTAKVMIEGSSNQNQSNAADQHNM